MKTRERLYEALTAAGAPPYMLERAARGGYDDFECEESATPALDLYTDAKKSGLTAIAEACKNGEFDATREESNAWFERDGHALLPGLKPKKQK